MNIKTTYKQLDSTPAIDEVTNRKSEKLKKYFQGKLNLSWTFTVEKKSHIAHCHLTGNNMDYFAEATTESIYSAIDETILALEKQVKRHKEQVKNHHVKIANKKEIFEEKKKIIEERDDVA